MQNLRIAYDQTKGAIPPERRRLSDVFRDCANGLPPRQPHADGDLLITEAFIAQENLRKIGSYIKAMLGCGFELGPAKDLDRAKEKSRAKLTKDTESDSTPSDAEARKEDGLERNCDFSRARGLLNGTERIKKAIDLFGQRGPVTLKNGNKSLTLHVVDVDNSFSDPNPKKANLRNLDIKLAVPITLQDGSETYHICEIQFIHKGAKKAYAQSEECYKAARREMVRMQYLENAMDMCTPESVKMLEKNWYSAQSSHAKNMEQRRALNRGVVDKYGLDDLIGYQPCVFCGAKNLAKAQVQPI